MPRLNKVKCWGLIKKNAYEIYEWPLSDHLPVGCKKICLSFSAEGPSKASDLVPETDEPICLVIGAIAKGKYFGGFYFRKINL